MVFVSLDITQVWCWLNQWALQKHTDTIRLQNSPHFCVFKYARAVKQKVWNEAENRERDWAETLRFTDFFTDFEKKTDCFAVYDTID